MVLEKSLCYSILENINYANKISRKRYQKFRRFSSKKPVPNQDLSNSKNILKKKQMQTLLIITFS